MKFLSPKLLIRTLVILIVICLGVLVYAIFFKSTPVIKNTTEENNFGPKYNVIGKSVQDRVIESYTYGKGEKHVVFVGGIHGGYEWNSVLLAYKFIDYLNANPTFVPDNLTITVIPSANPDGLYMVTGKEGRFLVTDVKSDLLVGTGRFNNNNVDLNRNFDCNWQATSTWKSNVVSAGATVFSEPEAKAIKNFMLKTSPALAVFWHSQSNAVYASECNFGILPKTLEAMNVYSLASGYPAVESFDSYKVTGDAEGWLASIKIPAITVELKTHETIEWEQNLAGIKALFENYRGK